MTYLIFNFMFLSIFAIARSQECDSVYKNANLEEVDMKRECSTSKPCIVKCCPLNQIYFRPNRSSYRYCMNVTDILNDYNHIDWSKIPLNNSIFKLYKNVEESLSSRTFDSLMILQNEDFRLLRPECVKPLAMKTKPTLMENGKLSLFLPSNFIDNGWKEFDTSMFCVENNVLMNDINTPLHNVQYLLRKDIISKDTKSKYLFVAITFTISSFFLALVLIVYSLTDMLKSLQGLMLFAYVGSLLVAQLLKASYIFNTFRESQKKNTDGSLNCELNFQLSYFFYLASFFWLNSMSFDVWWTFRGRLKNRAIHRRGIRVKFMIYALYAFGAPAAMTTLAVIIDKLPEGTLSPTFVTPGFSSCLPPNKSFYYLFVPVMILTGMNTLWFSFTVYNIWQSKKAMDNFDKRADSTKSKSDTKTTNKKTFWVYIRLSLLMGISWILELSQSKVKESENELPLWGYVILNLYTVLTGLVIFIMFICKKDVILKLCKRFNIENRWTRHFLSSSRNDSNKTTCKSYSRSTGRSKVAETDLEDPLSSSHTESASPTQKNDALDPKFIKPTN